MPIEESRCGCLLERAGVLLFSLILNESYVYIVYIVRYRDAVSRFNVILYAFIFCFFSTGFSRCSSYFQLVDEATRKNISKVSKLYLASSELMPGLPSGFARSLVNKISKAQRILVADKKTTGKVGDDGVQVSIGNLPGLQPFGAGIGKQFLIFKMWESDVVTFAHFVVKTIVV